MEVENEKIRYILQFYFDQGRKREGKFLGKILYRYKQQGYKFKRFRQRCYPDWTAIRGRSRRNC